MLYQQIIGRGLRVSKETGKKDCLILDHSDSTITLGYVTDIDERNTELDMGRHGRGESKKKKTERMPKECPKCNFLKPVGVHECPECGFKPEKQTDIVHMDGELKELDGKKKKYTIDEKKQFYAELKYYCEDKKFKPGWAAFKYKEKFGSWPNHPNIKYIDPVEPSQATLNWIKFQLIRWAKRRK
jgi:superfamily II DNA or RNA helicase